jgi:hypothetical protein
MNKNKVVVVARVVLIILSGSLMLALPIKHRHEIGWAGEPQHFGDETFQGQIPTDGGTLGTVGNPHKRGSWKFALKNGDGKVKVFAESHPIFVGLGTGDIRNRITVYCGAGDTWGTEPKWQPTVEFRK